MLSFTVCVLSFALHLSIGQVHAENYYEYYNENTITCSTTESIIGGTVNYTNGAEVGSEATYYCKDGYKPYPVSKKVCNSEGQWEPKISKMICEEEDEYSDYEVTQKNCSVLEVIRDGSVSYSNEGLEGSVLTYHCGIGRYPFPVKTRVCNSRGEWSTMVLSNGKTASAAVCKEILCPAQLRLDSGEFWPRKQWFKIGEEQSFSCKEGVTLLGSARRNCTEWGQWTGAIPVCHGRSEDCGNPATPPGAMLSGDRFRIGDKVKYYCQSGLDLVGPEERVCLDSKEWSGAIPSCQAHYMFDLPSTVAQDMYGSLSAVMDVLSPDLKRKGGPSYERTLNVEGGHFNIFILIDTSGSISKDQFEKAQQATSNLIRKGEFYKSELKTTPVSVLKETHVNLILQCLDACSIIQLASYEVKMRFDVISYASEPIDIIKILDYNSDNVDHVLKKLNEFNQTSTNLYKALCSVYEKLAFLKEQKKSHFNETQNVIIIETDGNNNMGGNPHHVLDLIRTLLGYKMASVDNTEEELLDVYMFGIGENIKRNKLTSIASNKRREKHLFFLNSYADFGKIFNRMINDTAVTKCGVAHELDLERNDEEDSEASQPAFTRPWHVTVSWVKNPCQGSILTENWVITAAHCLSKVNEGNVESANAKDVNVEHGEGKVDASRLIIHPQFDVKGLLNKNVKEFYDYDVALVKVNNTIKLSFRTRPVCLPCTKASNRALKMNPHSTCEAHKRALLDQMEIQAHFIRQGKTRMQTHIQTGEKRADCIEQYKPAISSNELVSLTDVVTERFLCTGGSSKHKDDIACKGDSGGALFLRKGMRYFQVGVVSWGTKLVCDSNTKSIPDPPKDARDFHISVFAIMSWLKQHLDTELEFLT